MINIGIFVPFILFLPLFTLCQVDFKQEVPFSPLKRWASPLERHESSMYRKADQRLLSRGFANLDIDDPLGLNFPQVHPKLSDSKVLSVNQQKSRRFAMNSQRKTSKCTLLFVIVSIVTLIRVFHTSM